MKFNKNWTLFLDRDGVINKRIPNDYVRNIEQFQFIEGSLEAIVQLSHLFGTTVVVTNQQGVGKGLMTKNALEKVHASMIDQVKDAGGHIDQVYYCPTLAKEEPICRKPNPGMAFQAQKDFPHIDFNRSIMVGDSISDIEFGYALGMKTAYVTSKEPLKKSDLYRVDFVCDRLLSFALALKFSD